MKTTDSKQQAISPEQIRFVFLDRDGVINCKPPEGEYVSSWDHFHILPGAESAIASLNSAGIRVIVVSNQRGVALGMYAVEDVDALHARLRQHLSAYGAHIDAFYFCPHDNNQCNCRKPSTGLIEQAFHDFREASPLNSVLIGDSLSDIEAARNVGMPAILVAGPPETQKPGSDKALGLADRVCHSLGEAVEQILT